VLVAPSLNFLIHDWTLYTPSRSWRPAGRQLPFPVRHVDRYPAHYRPAFAFSCLLFPL